MIAAGTSIALENLIKKYNFPKPKMLKSMLFEHFFSIRVKGLK